MPGPDPRKARLMQGPQGRRSKEKKESVPFVIDPETGMKIFIKTIEMGKDGKTTFAGVLIGRGVLPKGKKKKMMAKKSKSPMDKTVRRA